MAKAKHARAARKITFLKSWFNPRFYWLISNVARYVVMYGGSGSGKSYAIAKALVYRCVNDKYFRCIYMRKVKNDIRDSCYALLKQTIEEGGLEELFHFNSSTMTITCKINGNKFIARGMDSTEKVKSITDPSFIWLEEASEFTKEDFDQLDLRLRTDKSSHLQMILSLNPVSITNWIYVEFFSSAIRLEDGTYRPTIERTHLHKSTYRDNKYIDQEQYGKSLERIRASDYTLYLIYSNGEWGVEDPNKLFIRNFDRELHLSSEIEYDAEREVYVSLDFNVRNTALIFQYTDEFIYCLREYRPENDDLEDLCKQIRADYPGAFFFVNGDASGGNGSALTKGGASAFELVRQYLGEDGYPLAWEQIRKPRANPRHNSSRLITNIIMKNEARTEPGRGLKIHTSCLELIKDFESVKWIDGKIDKSQDSKGRTHCLDAFRYHIWFEHRERIRFYGLDILIEKGVLGKNEAEELLAA